MDTGAEILLRAGKMRIDKHGGREIRAHVQ
jgi:hypothetical protein